MLKDNCMCFTFRVLVLFLYMSISSFFVFHTLFSCHFYSSDIYIFSRWTCFSSLHPYGLPFYFFPVGSVLIPLLIHCRSA